MNRYPINAITVKTLDRFSYDIYSAISVNMLKYNHDTSATIRLLSSFINTSKEVIEDLPYQISFKLQNLEFINIDRMNAFYWPQIPGFTVNSEEETNYLLGYSSYTNKTYTLKRIEKQPDFIRHSLPADSFFSGPVIDVGESATITLSPYIKDRTVYDIKNSQVTIRPISGFSELSLDSLSPIKITLYGIDIRGNKASEEINIVANIDYVTETEWKRISGVIATKLSKSVTIMLFRYITGDIVISKDLIIDRQQFDPGICVLTVNRDRKQLVYNMLREDIAEYPLGFNLLKTVPLAIQQENTLFSHYIDESNKLLYTVDEGGEGVITLSCFPLMIPVTPSNTLDSEKTEYQAISVEYEEDCINEEWNLWLYPTSKTNDVETCNIKINGEEYLSGLLLDLYKYNIETNRITIPFADIYTASISSALIEIETYGAQSSYVAFTLDRTILSPLYQTDITNTITEFSNSLPDGQSFSYPSVSSSKVAYPAPNTVSWNGVYNIYKLSSTANIMLNGQKIINVFDTFYADDSNKYIVTSDTITNINGGEIGSLQFGNGLYLQWPNGTYIG